MKQKPIKSFSSLEKEAKFWESHDLSPLITNPKTPLSKLPKLESEKEEMMTLRLQKSVKKKLDEVAQTKGINTSTLARMWLIEKLQSFL